MRYTLRFLLAFTALTVACGGEKAADTAAADAAPAAAVDPSTLDPKTITAAELALGDSLYHGLIGATSCQACHGPDGKGGAVAPNLTDAEWLHGDGSYGAIYKQIETGVMQPKQFMGVMPPFGGAPLTPEKHRAVAAYVYSLSRPVAK